jgi:hypothetical protein
VYEIHDQFSTQIIIIPNLDLNSIHETERIALNTAIQRGVDAKELSALINVLQLYTVINEEPVKKEIRIQYRKTVIPECNNVQIYVRISVTVR